MPVVLKKKKVIVSLKTVYKVNWVSRKKAIGNVKCMTNI